MNTDDLHLNESDHAAVAAAAERQRGASLVEYALLVALIAVVCVGAVRALGSTTTVPYSEVTSGINGG